MTVRKLASAAGLVLATVAAYLCFWPVPAEPVAWLAPTPPGYTGAHASTSGAYPETLLTTNTMTSGARYGGDTEPPGYTRASIATIRLWKESRRR